MLICAQSHQYSQLAHCTGGILLGLVSVIQKISRQKTSWKRIFFCDEFFDVFFLFYTKNPGTGKKSGKRSGKKPRNPRIPGFLGPDFEKSTSNRLIFI